MVMTVLQDSFLEILFIHCLVKLHQVRNLGRQKKGRRTEEVEVLIGVLFMVSFFAADHFIFYEL